MAKAKDVSRSGTRRWLSASPLAIVMRAQEVREQALQAVEASRRIRRHAETLRKRRIAPVGPDGAVKDPGVQ